MKVKIDSTPLTGGHAVRGVGAYTRMLSEALKSNKEIALVDDDSFDIFHYPYFDLFFHTLPDNLSKPTIVTIHDVIPLLYPNYYMPGIKGKINLKKQTKALKKVKYIITDSETSKKDIIRFLKVPAAKIIPIYLAPDPVFKIIKNKTALNVIKDKYDLPEKFVLYVGDINYNKNVETLARACINYKIHLVIVGKSAGGINEVISDFKVKGIRDIARSLLGQTHPELAHYRFLAKLFASKYIVTLGFVDDADLVKIYNLANMYCQPSLYEGFGLPPLQALACGVPVISSKTQTLVEVLEKGAVYFEPTDVDGLINQINSLTKDKGIRESIIKEGTKQLGKFNWDKTAKETISVYKKALQ